jgi:DNA-binding Xre family transcriptional regulator
MFIDLSVGCFLLIGDAQSQHLFENSVAIRRNPLKIARKSVILYYDFLYLHEDAHRIIIRRYDMTVRYDKLWAVMKDNKMKKSDLAKAAELSQYTMTKLNQDRVVSMEVMLRLCKIFHCDIGDLMEVIEND